MQRAAKFGALPQQDSGSIQRCRPHSHQRDNRAAKPDKILLSERKDHGLGLERLSYWKNRIVALMTRSFTKKRLVIGRSGLTVCSPIAR